MSDTQLNSVKTITRSALLCLFSILLVTLPVSVNPSPQTQIRIMPLGDSITRGGGSTGEVGYRRPLYLLLEQSGYDVNFVGTQLHGTFLDFDRDHEGHGSYRADQVRDLVISWLDLNPADIVLLHIGINDIAWNNEDPLEVDALLDSIDVWESNNHPVTVIVARIVLRWDGNDPETIAFNDSVEAIVNQRITEGDDLIMVDMEHALIYPTDLADGVHPNDNGYAKMADVWYDALVPIIPVPDTIAPFINVDNVLLQPTSPDNTDDDSLFCSYNLTGLATGASVGWFRNDSALAVLHAPFEGGPEYSLLNLSDTQSLTILGAPVFDSLSGFDGFGAYQFGGSDGLYQDWGFPAGHSYSVTAWVQRTGPGGFIFAGSQTTGGHALHAFGGVYGKSLAAGHNGNWELVLDPDTLAIGEWYFVGVTFDSTSGILSLYKNGIAIASSPVNPMLNPVTDTTLRIGSGPTAPYWQGNIDEVRLYDRPLSADQIRLSYEIGDHWIAGSETVPDEDWTAQVTPFSGASMGTAVMSNYLRTGLPAPQASNVQLQYAASKQPDNGSLVVSYSLQGSAEVQRTAVSWLRDGIPWMDLNMPFEGSPSDIITDVSGSGVIAVPAGAISPAQAWDSTAGRNGSGAFLFGTGASRFYLDAGSVLSTQSYTKSCWLKLTAYGTSLNVLSGKMWPTGGHVMFASGSVGNKMSAGHNGATTVVQDNVNGPLQLNQWYHYAVTYDGSTGEMILYANGVPVDTGIAEPVTDPSLLIGSLTSIAGNEWVGYIDDVRIFRHPLSAEQIAALYNDAATLSLQETSSGESWEAVVTPFSGSARGASVVSNPVTITNGTITPPDLCCPPSGFNSTEYDLTPTFDWLTSYNPYVGRTLYYRFAISTDSLFSSPTIIDSIISPGYEWTDSLGFQTRYWWTVTAWVNLDTGTVEMPSDTVSFWTWTLGDVDATHSVDVGDLTFMVTYMFKGGQTVTPAFAMDLNNSCSVDVADLTYFVGYSFKGGPPPVVGCE
jgi:lysophospholipase L1-like esterase